MRAVRKKEKNIIKDLNHKISRKIVEIARENGCGIKLENLKGIRKTKGNAGGTGKSRRVNKTRNTGQTDRYMVQSTDKQAVKISYKIADKTADKNEAEKPRWSSEYTLNSWSFRQLQQFIEYKARLQGVEVTYIDPHATSKRCSRCGHMGRRHSKHFECPNCGHVDHADVNAAFNIALAQKGFGQFTAERDAVKGSTDTPPKSPARLLLRKRAAGQETSPHFVWEVCQFLA